MRSIYTRKHLYVVYGCKVFMGWLTDVLYDLYEITISSGCLFNTKSKFTSSKIANF